MHEKGICHRDLKPENILLTKEEHVIKITDFEYCGFIQNEKTRFKEICGTLNYAAPEVITSNKRKMYDGKKADIWSLGCILYTLLSSYFAFDDDDPNQLIKMIKNDEPVFPTQFFTKQSKEFILKMLEKDPKKRLTIHQVKSHNWMKNNSYKINL
jgi:serine/threonine protein kinase